MEKHSRPLTEKSIPSYESEGVCFDTVVDVGSPGHDGTCGEECEQLALRQTVVAVDVVLVEEAVEELHSDRRQLGRAGRRHVQTEREE